MHLLIVTDSYPPHLDGHAVSVAWWEQTLRTAGWRVTVSSPQHLRLRERPDVLFVHGYGLRTAAVVAAYPGVPIVSFVHRHAYLDVPDLFPRTPRVHPLISTWLYRRQQRFLEYSTHIFTPSERTARITRAMVPGIPVSVAITGVGSEFHAAAGTARPAQPPIALYVGRRSPDKNFTRLISLAQSTPQWHWHAIGAPGPDDVAATQAGFTLRGHVTPQEVIAALSEASVLLLPSEQETQGLAALEALTIGVPVVAPEGSAQAELLTPAQTGGTYANDATDAEIVRVIEQAMALAPLAEAPDLEADAIDRVMRVLQQARVTP